MKILIDIGHPAHVHLFKNFAHRMENCGHKVLFTCRDKEFEIELLKKERFDYISFGRKYKSTIGKIIGLLKFDLKEYAVCRRLHPDVLLSHGSPYAAHAAWLIRKPHISFEDTYNFEQIRLYEPFTDTILSSSYAHPFISAKDIRYDGYHELAYLHPNVFTPDKSVLKELGISEGEKYIIMRFVAWNASHDRGHSGIPYQAKLDAVKEFSKIARVFISSEKELPVELLKYKLHLAPERMHHALAFASLVYGESSTMSEEAAMLGVPSIYFNYPSTCYTQHLEKEYGLMYNFGNLTEDYENGKKLAIEILSIPEKSKSYKEKARKMLSEKIDVTAFMSWFVTNYPESKHIMEDTSEYQKRFR